MSSSPPVEAIPLPGAPGDPESTKRHERLVARSFATLGAGEWLARLISFAVTILVARQLGVEAYGIIGFAFALMLYAATVVDLGLEHLGPREVVDRAVPLDALVSSMLLARLAAAALLSAGLALFGTLILAQPEGSVLAIYGLTLLAAGANAKWVHLGFDRSGLVAAARLVGELVKLLLVLALVRDPDDILAVPVSYVLSDALGAALLLVALRLHGIRIRPRLDRATVRDVLGRARPLLVANVLGLVIYNADVVLLRVFRDRAEVGLYLAAYALISFLGVLGNASMLALVPSFRRLHTALESRNALYRSSMFRMFTVGIPLAVGGALLAPAIIDLVFGSVYAASTLPLRILIWTLPLQLLRCVLQAALIAGGRQDFVLRTTAWAATVNIGLNLIAIPLFGLVGAAATTVIAEATRLGLAQSYAKGVGFGPIAPRSFWPPAAAVAGMALTLQLARPGSVLLAVPLGAVMYGVLLAAMAWLSRRFAAGV